VISGLQNFDAKNVESVVKAANRGGTCLIPVWLLDLYICDDDDDDDLLSL